MFPDNTPPEKYLFDLLKRGYIDARYKDHYEINAEELAQLIERVSKLQTIPFWRQSSPQDRDADLSPAGKSQRITYWCAGL